MNIITELYERWTRTQLTQVNIEEREAFEFNRGLTTSVVDPKQNMTKGSHLKSPRFLFWTKQE